MRSNQGESKKDGRRKMSRSLRKIQFVGSDAKCNEWDVSRRLAIEGWHQNPWNFHVHVVAGGGFLNPQAVPRHVVTSSATSDRYKSSRRYLQCHAVKPGPSPHQPPAISPVCTRRISIWKIRETYKCSCQSQPAPLTPLSNGRMVVMVVVGERGGRCWRRYVEW